MCKCGCCKNPLMLLVKLIAVVSLVYGLWNQNWTYIIIGAVICVIGIIVHSIKCNCKEEAKEMPVKAAAKPKRKRR